jgi:hypothetical protein
MKAPEDRLGFKSVIAVMSAARPVFPHESPRWRGSTAMCTGNQIGASLLSDKRVRASL